MFVHCQDACRCRRPPLHHPGTQIKQNHTQDGPKMTDRTCDLQSCEIGHGRRSQLLDQRSASGCEIPDATRPTDAGKVIADDGLPPSGQQRLLGAALEALLFCHVVRRWSRAREHFLCHCTGFPTCFLLERLAAVNKALGSCCLKVQAARATATTSASSTACAQSGESSVEPPFWANLKELFAPRMSSATAESSRLPA